MKTINSRMSLTRKGNKPVANVVMKSLGVFVGNLLPRQDGLVASEGVGII
jgi:hypothetical protein